MSKKKGTLENPLTDEQLKGITIIISSVDYDDEGNPYASTNIYRGDLVGSIDEFIYNVESRKQIVHLSNMKSE